MTTYVESNLGGNNLTSCLLAACLVLFTYSAELNLAERSIILLDHYSNKNLNLRAVVIPIRLSSLTVTSAVTPIPAFLAVQCLLAVRSNLLHL